MAILTLKKINELLEWEELAVSAPMGKLTKAYCETYGTKTYVFIPCRGMVQRQRVEATLVDAGVEVNERYCRRSGGATVEQPIVQARCSYLRAKGWNE